MYKAALSMAVKRKPSVFHCFIDAATNCKTHLFFKVSGLGAFGISGQRSKSCIWIVEMFFQWQRKL